MSCGGASPMQATQETFVLDGLMLHRLPVALWLNHQQHIGKGRATRPKGKFLLNLWGHLQEQADLQTVSWWSTWGGRGFPELNPDCWYSEHTKTLTLKHQKPKGKGSWPSACCDSAVRGWYMAISEERYVVGVDSSSSAPSTSAHSPSQGGSLMETSGNCFWQAVQTYLASGGKLLCRAN